MFKSYINFLKIYIIRIYSSKFDLNILGIFRDELLTSEVKELKSIPEFDELQFAGLFLLSENSVE